jgi:dual specificity phosphatase 3
MSALPVLHAANADFVTPQLLVGGDFDYQSDELAGRQLAELVEAGLTHIVDVRVEWSDEDFVRQREPRIEYLHHGVDDVGQVVPASWFDRGVGYALKAIKRGGVVLTHCHMGINRGPSLGFAVLLAEGWDPVLALHTIRTARPIAFVAYAEDALAWWHQDPARLEEELERLALWRRENQLDVAAVIRMKRAQEQRGA